MSRGSIRREAARRRSWPKSPPRAPAAKVQTPPIGRLVRDIGYKWRKLVNPSGHTYKIEWIHGYDVTAMPDSGAEGARLAS